MRLSFRLTKADGDYNGDSSALYQSKDNGETWEFVEEVKKK
ncbi:hypothetical protein NPM07_32320 [Bacillus cereus]|nr:hypothetical protein [Bacillus cereus]